MARNLALKLNALLPFDSYDDRKFFKTYIPLYAEALATHLQSEHTRLSLDEHVRMVREAECRFVVCDLALLDRAADQGFAHVWVIEADSQLDPQAVFGAFVERNADSPVVLASRSGQPRDVAAMLQGALLAWARDELPGMPETWQAFGDRVRQAGQGLQALAGDGEVLVLSSGGVISRLAQMALDVPVERAVELNLSLRNSAVSEFHPHGPRLRLGSWNALPHLHGQRELWTYY